MSTQAPLLARILRAPLKGWLALSLPYNRLKAAVWGVSVGRGTRLEGRIYLRRDGGSIVIGEGVHITGGYCRNRISRNLATSLCTQGSGRIEIGPGCGISSSCLWAREEITLGRNVQIGADCKVLDHDAHSLDPAARLDYAADYASTRTAPVRIGDDVLVGTGAIILKGVTIGRGSVVGAGSVVTRDIPAGEVWAGNPAVRLRSTT